MKRYTLALAMIVVASSLTLLAAEGIAQLYVYKVAQKGKLFRPDPRVGWKPISDLRLKRLNADGKVWSVRTDEDGMRGFSAWDPNAPTRVLIVGDSFAFGEGVDIDRRFDAIIEGELPHVSIVNVGVLGYGTDQQMIAARPYLRTLRNEDILVVLTYQNDFFDILRKKHSGRAKPWFELIGGEVLEEHAPDISWIEILRDKSYIFSTVSALFEQHRQFTDSDVSHAAKLYEAIILNETKDAVGNGVRILIAFHGIDDIISDSSRQIIEKSLNDVCSMSAFRCLSLETQLIEYDRSKIFLADGHWNAVGHAIVAKAIGNWISEVSFKRWP